MSTYHAAAGEVVNLATWVSDLPADKSKAIVKTDAKIWLHTGQLVYPESQTKHVVTGVQDAVVLLTIVLT